MIFSDAFPITFNGKPAQIRVIRNDGFCWGRLITKRSERDVYTKRDYYEQEDLVAAQAFERAAKRGNIEPPAASWRIGWAEA